MFRREQWLKQLHIPLEGPTSAGKPHWRQPDFSGTKLDNTPIINPRTSRPVLRKIVAPQHFAAQRGLTEAHRRAMMRFGVEVEFGRLCRATMPRDVRFPGNRN
ncbi:hypothetical protein [Croceicoccus mobilis]|uniref:hypothetical protein n=1 Tax=Croceicoccus mobilis TaxID=1703339 RepID=UPI0012E7A490|nr:hypothetical protein [Croceicoccus mobilis]